jgi:hypothetical protein
MKKETLFLKLAVILVGLPVLALCIYGLFELTNNPANQDYAYVLYPILIGVYVSLIPFYIALYKAFRLLGYIDKNKAFSQISVEALKHIKYCSVSISILYVVMMPFVFLLTEKDDAPGLIIFGIFPIFASMVIAVFASVLQKLLSMSCWIQEK